MPRQHDEYRRCAIEVADIRFMEGLPYHCWVEFAQTAVYRARGSHGPREAPPIAVKHRQRPEKGAVAVEPCFHCHCQRLEISAAMVIHAAFWLSGGAACVIDREQPALVADLAM